MVYFIKEKDTSYIKIGYSKNLDGVNQRLLSLQTGNPRELEILFCFKAGFDVEKHLHDAYKDFRLKGEWFDIGHIMEKEGSQEKIINYFEKKERIKKEKKEKKRKERYEYYNEVYNDICKGIKRLVSVNPDKKIKWHKLEVYVVNKFTENSYPYFLSKHIFSLATDDKEHKSYDFLEGLEVLDIDSVVNEIIEHNNKTK